MRNRNAYFTVEAALVLPVVIGAILFVIYMMLFQYDRCLLEQDIGGIALWGSIVEASDTAELEQKVQTRISELYRGKYVAWRMTKLDASVGRNRFCANGAGQLTFPVPGWNFWSADNMWGTAASYEYSRLSPVTFIRLCHRFGEEAGR
ncbi:MAG: hypothetical protein HFH96_10025 [Lachnospiraceae bacterium]|jgi:hypothetical protein|nr:hypothetical protein [uncultured Acetatifactor sp.]MCI9231427.1 hypothetical protein [Lachnospiraceae bacterium]